MEEMKKDMGAANQNNQSCCQGGMCSMGHGCCHGHGFGRFMLLRWVLMVFIVAVVFAIGVKVGEFKAEYGYGYQGGMHYHTMMMGKPNMMYMNSGQPTMMRSTTTPATTTK